MALQARFAAALAPGSRGLPAASRLTKATAESCAMRTAALVPGTGMRSIQCNSFSPTPLGGGMLQDFVARSSGQGRSGRRFPERPGAGVRAAATTAVVAPTEEETQQMIAEVRRVLDEKHSDLPLGEYGRDDEAMIQWFLRDRKFEVEPTVAKLAKAIKWRHEFGVAFLKPEDVAQEAATGKAYLHDHPALDGRPVIVVVAAKHFPNEERLVASEQLCVYLIEQALARLPEGEEKFLGIFDLRGFNHQNADFKFVGFLIQVFFNYYPKRLHKVLFVDAPPIFQPGWRIMKPMLKSYASLVEFCSANDVRERYFEPNQAPPSFLQ